MLAPQDPDAAASAPEALARGRAAHARRAWADAYGALEDADREHPLDLEDLERLVEAAALSGRVDEHLQFGERAFHAHLERGERLAAALTAFWLGFRLLSLGERTRASGWLTRARRIVDCDGADCVVQGFLLLAESTALLHAGELERAEQLLVEAVAIGERFANADLVTLARQWQARVLLRLGRVEGFSVLDEAMLSVVSQEVSPIVTGLVYCGAIAIGQRLCAFDRTREWTLQLSAWCAAQPQLVPFSGICMVHRAEIQQLGGDWAEALDSAERATAALSPRTDPQALADAWYQQAEIHRLRGEHDAAEAAYGRSSRAGRDPQPGLSLLRLAQGRGEAALAGIRRALVAAGDPQDRLRLLPAQVEIALVGDELRDARAGAEELDGLAARLGVDLVRAMADHALGSVLVVEGRSEAAIPYLRRSLAAWNRLGAAYLSARIRVDLARAFRLLGDDDGAQLELAAARDVFERLGARSALAAIDGPRAPTAPVKTAGGLSARELEVLRLVAKGLTNRAIAGALGLSEKTVDRHVSNMFTKLDVASRTAATAYAYEHGLLAPAERPVRS